MKQILSFIKTYVIFVLLFVAQKPLFLLLEKSSSAAQTIIYGIICLELFGMDCHLI